MVFKTTAHTDVSDSESVVFISAEAKRFEQNAYTGQLRGTSRDRTYEGFKAPTG